MWTCKDCGGLNGVFYQCECERVVASAIMKKPPTRPDGSEYDRPDQVLELCTLVKGYAGSQAVLHRAQELAGLILKDRATEGKQE